MSRGNKRDIDRARAQARNEKAGGKTQKEKDGLTPEQRRERDAKALQEQAARPAVLDACLRGAGFRMGPCELMDLIGHDTNFALTRSVYEANFQRSR